MQSKTEKVFEQKKTKISSSVAAVNQQLEEDLINFEHKLQYV
jgi:hypothetical protein